MRTVRSVTLACLVAAVSAGPAAALGPDEVLVVANSAEDESVALAKLYAERRGIDAGNVLLVKTTQRTDVSRPSYDAQIRDPIRKALTDRKLKAKVRCICLMWGMPLRVAGPPDAETKKVPPAVRTAAMKMRYRIATDYKMLATVGKTFPEPRTEGLAPVASLFSGSMPEPENPPVASKFVKTALALLSRKDADVARLRDASQRRTAARQLMAMYLELRGLRGLLAHVRAANPPGAPKVEDIRKQLTEVERRIAAMRSDKSKAMSIEALELVERADGLLTAAVAAERMIGYTRSVNHLTKSVAAVDSELSLLWKDGYSLAGPAANALYWRSRATAAKAGEPALMAARIDGPTRADAMRIIKASIAVEAKGLDGTFYIDAGGPARLPANVRGAYDARLKALHQFVKAHTKVKVVLDDAPTLFAPDSCPFAALYVGWYSLKTYVPAFMWTPGAVGWHVASWEAVHLRDASSNEWCVKMIQNGVAATVGAVGEPLLGSFPEPEAFFPLLLTGKYTVAECYWRTVPNASWQMTLIADPLYNPFKAKPQLDVSALPKGLAP